MTLNRNKKKLTAGFSTLEVLVAMTLLILALTAVVIVSFGNQSLVGDSQTNNEALTKAQALLEEEQVKDFSTITSQAEVTDSIYKKRVDVVTPWNGDLKIKKITATVTWNGNRNQPLQVQLSALVTDFKHP